MQRNSYELREQYRFLTPMRHSGGLPGSSGLTRAEAHGTQVRKTEGVPQTCL